MSTNKAPAAKTPAEPWYPFGSGPPIPAVAEAKAEQRAAAEKPEQSAPHRPLPWNPGDGPTKAPTPSLEAKAEQPRATAKPEQHATAKPAEPWYPFGSGPPIPAVAGAKAEQSAEHPYGSWPARTHAPAALAAAAAPAVQHAASVKAGEAVGAPQPVTVKAAAPAADIAKAEAPSKAEHVAAKTAKPQHARAHPAPQGAFAEALQAEAKDRVQANNVIASALSQGLPLEAIKAVAERRLKGHSQEIGLKLLASAPDVGVLASKLGESREAGGALQAAASKASTPAEAQAIIASRLKGDSTGIARDSVSALAATQKEVSIAAAGPSPITVEKVASLSGEVVGTAPAAPSRADFDAAVVEAWVAAFAPEAALPVSAAASASVREDAASVQGAIAQGTAFVQTFAVQEAVVVQAPAQDASAQGSIAQDTAFVQTFAVQEAIAVSTALAQDTKPEQTTVTQDATSTSPAEAQGATYAQAVVVHGATSAPVAAAQDAAYAQEAVTQDATAAPVTQVAQSAQKTQGLEAASPSNGVFVAESPKISLEQALSTHMKERGFDAESVSIAPMIAGAIREGQLLRATGDEVLVLHKEGKDGEALATMTSAKDLSTVARAGDSVLAMDTLEKVANHGLDAKEVQGARDAAPEKSAHHTDLEVAQSSGPSKTAFQGLDMAGSKEGAGAEQNAAAREETQLAKAESSRGAEMSI